MCCSAIIDYSYSFFSLTGCTFNHTKRISDKLDVSELYEHKRVYPIKLSLTSKCNKPPTIKIVNDESRVEDYVVREAGFSSVVINPKEIMDAVSLYLQNGYMQSDIKVDNQADKTLHVKMNDLKLIDDGGWSMKGHFKLELNVPETGYVNIYEAKDSSPLHTTAAAEAMHSVTRQIIDDPIILNYILCTTEFSDNLKVQKMETTLNQKLQDLKTSLVNGLISEEEYQLKRKELIEKF